jgi:F-box associated protein
MLDEFFPVDRYRTTTSIVSNLPSEMILDIADQLDDAGMNALARTNRRMYDLLNKRLYRRDVAESRYRSLTWVARNGMEATVRRVVDNLCRC